jgi:hypothetical protein
MQSRHQNVFDSLATSFSSTKKAVLADGFVKETLGRLTAAPEHGQQSKSTQQTEREAGGFGDDRQVDIVHQETGSTGCRPPRARQSEYP